MTGTSARYFVDSNIVVYAYDKTESGRHEQAKALLIRLWEKQLGVLSTQVLQEYYAVSLRKSRGPETVRQIQATLQVLAKWPVVTVTPGLILMAAELSGRYQISFWDGLIIAAASAAQVDAIFSEDLSHRQLYSGIPIINPLRPDFDLESFMNE